MDIFLRTQQTIPSLGRVFRTRSSHLADDYLTHLYLTRWRRLITCKCQSERRYEQHANETTTADGTTTAADHVLQSNGGRTATDCDATPSATAASTAAATTTTTTGDGQFVHVFGQPDANHQFHSTTLESQYANASVTWRTTTGCPAATTSDATTTAAAGQATSFMKRFIDI